VRGVEVTGLEDVLVAVDRAFCAVDLFGERRLLVCECGSVGVVSCRGLLGSVAVNPPSL
jgi:hypothetical protein